MFAKRVRGVFGPALLAILVSGCGTADPGGGFTNGPAPSVAPSNPDVRTDIPPPDMPDADVAAGKAGAGSADPAKPAPDTSAPAPKTP